MEKKVILEEIGMYEDQPTYTAYERLMQTHFASHPLGRSVLGTNESITALASEQMREYHDRRYAAGNILLAVAGHFEWPEVLELATKHCGHWPQGEPLRATEEARPQGGLSLITKAGSLQEHVMQMAAAPPATSPLRFAADILAVIIGDDTGSRLFWELVDPGHAETAEMGYNEFDGSGAYMSYFSSTPETAEFNLKKLGEIFDDINQHGVREEELVQARNKVASRIVLRSERPMGRLASLGHNWLYRREYRSVAADLETLRGITRAEIRQLLDAYPLVATTMSAVGPMKELGGNAATA